MKDKKKEKNKMEMAAVRADWSKRLIKTREGEEEGGMGDSR